MPNALVIESDETVLRILEAYFAEHGYVYLVTDSEMEAFVDLATRSMDLIIIDPHIDDLLLEDIRSNSDYEEIPIIVLKHLSRFLTVEFRAASLPKDTLTKASLAAAVDLAYRLVGKQ